MAVGFYGAKDGVAAMKEGRKFGQTGTQQDCQETTWVRAAKCGQMDFSCPVATENFLKGCLMTATETPGFCENIPVGKAESMEDAFALGLEAAQFAQDTCANLGATSFRPRDQSLRPTQQVCVQVIQARAIHCSTAGL